jgi:hypothetical protein
VDPKAALEQHEEQLLEDADVGEVAPGNEIAQQDTPLVRVSTHVREIHKDGVYEARFRPEPKHETRLTNMGVVLLNVAYIAWSASFFASAPFLIALLTCLTYFIPLALLNYIAYASHRDFVVRIADRHVEISRGAISLGGTTSMEIEAIEAFVVTDLTQQRPQMSVVNARFIDGRHQTLTLGTNDREKLEQYAEHLNAALVEGKRRSYGYRG